MKSVLRTVRNTLISVVALILLFATAGVIYVLVSGKSGPKQAVAVQAANTVEASPALKPRTPSPNAKESAAVTSITSPVAAGSNSSVTVKTNATSVCKIKITKDQLVYKDSGLTDKTADNFGTATWTWTMAKTVPLGKWLIQVDCTYNKRSAMVQADLIVTK